MLAWFGPMPAAGSGETFDQKMQNFTQMTWPALKAVAGASGGFMETVDAGEIISIPAAMVLLTVVVKGSPSVVRWGHAQRSDVSAVKEFATSLVTSQPHLNQTDYVVLKTDLTLDDPVA